MPKSVTSYVSQPNLILAALRLYFNEFTESSPKEVISLHILSPNRGPYDYQGVKRATAAIMTDERKEIVQESAEEFKLDGLWSEDWNAGGQGKEIEIQD